jgi:hypothetical protein
MATTEQDSPEYQCPAYTEMAVGWDKVRAVRHLNQTLVESPGKILPKFESEDQIDYLARVGITDAFEAVDETIHALVGLATRHAPILGDDVPPRIQLDWEDLDGQGTHGDVFVQHLEDAALQDGHAGVLTDYPPAPRGMTLQQEQAGGYRAYAVLLPADRITSWRVGRVQGRMMLTMVKLRESREVEAGAFGNTTVERYRTLTQRIAGADGEADGVMAGEPYVTFVVHERKDGKSGEWVPVDEGVIRGPKYIPVRIAYGGERTGILRSRPPLRGLAYTSIAHTQVGSDLRSSMHKCAVPTPVFIGRDKTNDPANGGTIRMGSGIDVSVGGDAKYLEPTGAALDALDRYRENLKRQMGAQGFAMLRRDTPREATATEAILEDSKDSSKLAKMVRSANDCMEGVLADFAAFYGLEDGGSITMTRQFADLELTAEEIRVLSDMEERGQLTLETVLETVQKKSRILDGVDVSKEAAALRLAEAGASDPGFVPAGDQLPAAA